MSCEPLPIAWGCDPEGLLAGRTFLAPNPDTGDLEPIDAAVLIGWVQLSAESLLWSLTGRRLGVCEVVESYRTPPGAGCVRVPYLAGERGSLAWKVGAFGGRNCCRIRLWHQPVVDVTEVRLDGDVLDSDDYRVEGGWLVRRGECWPAELATCDDPRIEVTYRHGVPVGSRLEGPVALGLGEIACEIMRGLVGADCRLPTNAVSITRNGVTVELGDSAELWREGRTGLPLADSLIRTLNPSRLHRAPRFVSPDLGWRAR